MDPVNYTEGFVEALGHGFHEHNLRDLVGKITPWMHDHPEHRLPLFVLQSVLNDALEKWIAGGPLESQRLHDIEVALSAPSKRVVETLSASASESRSALEALIDAYFGLHQATPQ
jgi:hypothetical protein